MTFSKNDDKSMWEISISVHRLIFNKTQVWSFAKNVTYDLVTFNRGDFIRSIMSMERCAYYPKFMDHNLIQAIKKLLDQKKITFQTKQLG